MGPKVVCELLPDPVPDGVVFQCLAEVRSQQTPAHDHQISLRGRPGYVGWQEAVYQPVKKD